MDQLSPTSQVWYSSRQSQSFARLITCWLLKVTLSQLLLRERKLVKYAKINYISEKRLWFVNYSNTVDYRAIYLKALQLYTLLEVTSVKSLKNQWEQDPQPPLWKLFLFLFTSICRLLFLLQCFSFLSNFLPLLLLCLRSCCLIYSWLFMDRLWAPILKWSLIRTLSMNKC